MSEYPTYLIHYGIQGQKWGVRRFQNEDGTWTDDGLLRRKDQKHFVKEQEKTNKKFDKVTYKIQQRQAAGKKVSQRQINKAVDLGTKHRSLDYISRNPRAYLQANGLNKASKAKNAVGITGGVARTAAGAGMVAEGYESEGTQWLAYGVASIPESIAQRKLEKMFLNNWMQRQYGDVVQKSRDLTIKDLEKHGIKVNTDNKKYQKSAKKYRVLK